MSGPASFERAAPRAVSSGDRAQLVPPGASVSRKRATDRVAGDRSVPVPVAVALNCPPTASRLLSVSADPKMAPRPRRESSATWAPARPAYRSETGADAAEAGWMADNATAPAARAETVTVLTVRGMCIGTAPCLPCPSARVASFVSRDRRTNSGIVDPSPPTPSQLRCNSPGSPNRSPIGCQTFGRAGCQPTDQPRLPVEVHPMPPNSVRSHERSVPDSGLRGDRPGLPIAHHIDFPDYTLDELAAIGDLMLAQQSYEFTAETREVSVGISTAGGSSPGSPMPAASATPWSGPGSARPTASSRPGRRSAATTCYASNPRISWPAGCSR